jgi:peptidyl-prolyl cis-trans isomerase A (cyclophilin A)
MSLFQITLLLFMTVFLLSAFPSPDASGADQAKLSPGLYAIFETSMGKITCRLFEKEAPKTVANFVGLAEGTKEWTDPKTGQKTKRRFYDGLIFHRVIPEFMVQGGDPTGTGMGSPGYKFEDEFSPNLKFDQPGRLAMANAGPNTNGSQFFITEVPTPHLNNRHTIFGQCIEGMDVVSKMARASKGPMDRPSADVVIKKLTILRKK